MILYDHIQGVLNINSHDGFWSEDEHPTPVMVTSDVLDTELNIAFSTIGKSPESWNIQLENYS